MSCIDRKTYFRKLFALISVLSVSLCYGFTDPRDETLQAPPWLHPMHMIKPLRCWYGTSYMIVVFAINCLHVSLGLPVIPGWVPNGGDPCAENWLGVQCVNTNITGIILRDANLGGELGDRLADFTSIIEIDLSNNHIGGVIPSSLPSTLRTFSLSSNQFTGSIPETLSSLGQVTDLSFDNNHLTGEIPDAFQRLPGLINLHLQNNQLIGTLDVLQYLPLRDLNVENNLFSGPIPSNLLSIPNFRSKGNPFNTSVLPSPLVSSPLPSPSDSPSPDLAPASPSDVTPYPTTGDKSGPSRKITWIVISGVLLLILLGLGIFFLIYRCSKRMKLSSKIGRTYETKFYDDPKEKPKTSEFLPKLYSPRETGYKEPGLRPLIMHGKGHQKSTSSLNPNAKDGGYDTTSSITKNDDNEIDMSVLGEDFLPPPPPPFSPFDKVVVNPLLSPISTASLSTKIPSSVSSFTIASLQQYTNSFSQENLVGRRLIGCVYRAETPMGRTLAVKKLDTGACKSNEAFLELVCSVSKLQHPNIVELVGYCAEHGQQLLVYEYCGNGSLYEALHFDDEIHKNLSWKNRVCLALGAARALEYMHEVCQPPVVHKNFKSANILLDDELVVRISDCGLAPLLSSGSLSQLSSSGYGAPELELGSYTSQSDVYSFGVVMLEILTGRKSYDSSRPRGEQFLVRWAIHQLHDINSLARMVDPSLKGTYPTKSLSRFADIISLCLQPEPEFRPPMSEIVQNLLHMI